MFIEILYIIFETSDLHNVRRQTCCFLKIIPSLLLYWQYIIILTITEESLYTVKYYKTHEPLLSAAERRGTLPTADSWYRKPSTRLCLVCIINTDISPEMAAQSTQRNQAFCVTASDWSPITSA